MWEGGLPVDDAFLDECEEAVADLFEEVDGLLFWKFGVLGEVLFEVIVAYLLDDVVVVTAFHDVEHPHHILGFEQLQDLDL